MPIKSLNSFNTLQPLEVQGQSYTYFSLQELSKQLGILDRLPFSLKILLENLLRHENGSQVTADQTRFFSNWLKNRTSSQEVSYFPARVLMQDFTGVPSVVDLAAMRDAMKALGGDPEKINPLTPVDLIIDHSVIVDAFATKDAFQKNVSFEFARNRERYAFLRWGQKAFHHFRVVPPGTGICHQVNLEYLAQVVWMDAKTRLVYPDTLVGTDSHTTMINGLSVLGWGVGGIEAEAVMLGQPLSLVIPDVIGVKLLGQIPEGVTATDLVLTITHLLRAKGVVGKFVEFYGDGLDALSLPDRATIGNMAPEYGATCGLFPIDQVTIDYLTFTGRPKERIALVEAYAKEQGFWRTKNQEDPVFSDTLTLDLSTLVPTLAGPKRPQDKVFLSDAALSCAASLSQEVKEGTPQDHRVSIGSGQTLGHGDVVIAAITSCTNTSNPTVLVGAGLIARKALQRGLKVKPWVKTSLAPGSQVVTDYLQQSGLQADLEAQGFYLVGYGCTTCIGNSGPLAEPITQAIDDNDLCVAAVLSGNRNFEGRIHPQVKLNYLASPPLVVAYALAGSMKVDLTKDPLGVDRDGKPVYLKDIWPSNSEIQEIIRNTLTPALFAQRYADVFKGDQEWQEIGNKEGETYPWEAQSTYVKHPPYFEKMSLSPAPLQNIHQARILAILGDSITTDHISPAGSIKADSPAGTYLQKNGVDVPYFNSYGSRRGNHEVMIRGTFANIRLRNEMVPEITGGFTRHFPSQETTTIFEAAQRYAQENVPLIVIAGKEYGSGSSRDWAAKGQKLLGVKAVLAESFERIHRSNLIGMGILPLAFLPGQNRHHLCLQGNERFDILGLEDKLKPKMLLSLRLYRQTGENEAFNMMCRIDTEDELTYFQNGGILSYVLRQLLQKTKTF